MRALGKISRISDWFLMSRQIYACGLLFICFSFQASLFAQTPTKVKVGALDEEQDVGFSPEHANFSQLMDYHSEQLSSKPKQVLQSLNYFLYNHDDLSVLQISQLYFAFADVYQELENYSLAVSMLKNVYSLLEQSPAETEFRLENRLAELYEKSGLYAFAINRARRGYELAEQVQDKFQLASFSKLQANLYLSVGRLESARYWLARGKQHVFESADAALKVWYLFEKASWHETNQELFLAQQAVKKAILISEDNNFGPLQRSGQLKLVRLYLFQKKYLHAEPLLQSMFNLAQIQRDRTTQFLVLQQIVAMQLQKGNHVEADKYWQAMERLWRWVNVDSKQKQQLADIMSWQEIEILIGRNRLKRALSKLQSNEFENISLEWLQTELKLMLQLGTKENTQTKVNQLLRKTLKQNLDKAEARNRYNEYLYQQQVIGLQQQLANSNLHAKQQSHLLDNANFKAQWLIILLVVLLNVIGVYYVWRQYGGLLRNHNIYIDPLTQLPNYRAMCENGYDLINKGKTFSMILFDLDDFSEVNQRLGFRKADNIIVHHAQNWQGLMRRDCQLSRYSGDSFVVIAPDYDQTQAYVLAERLRIELNISAAEIQSSFIDLSASFAVIESDGSRPLQSLLRNAQEALDFIKRSGKNKSALV